MRNRLSSKHKAKTRDFAENPEVAELILRRDEEAVLKLLDLAASNERATAKAARKALYDLKLAGLSIPEPTTPHAGLIATAGHETVAYITTVDGFLSQILLFVQTLGTGQHPTVSQFATGYREGVAEAYSVRMSPRDIAEMLNNMRKEIIGAELVQIPDDYARHLLALFASYNVDLNLPLPQGYRRIASQVGTADHVYDRPLALDIMDVEAMDKDLSFSRDPFLFFGSSAFAAWIPNKEWINHWIDKYLAVEDSPLQLSETVLDRMQTAVIEQAADDLFKGSLLHNFRRCLEETALLLHLANREEEAKMALYQALAINVDLPPHESRFVMAYLRRSIELLLELETGENGEEVKREPSLIIRP